MDCRTKNALKKCYAAHGAALVAFETARLSGKGGHAHIQVVPIPLRFEEVVEETFRKEPGVEWESNPDDALKEAENTKSSYFRVDLPGGQKLVHIIRGRFDLQFGRCVAHLPDCVCGSNLCFAGWYWRSCLASQNAVTGKSALFLRKTIGGM